MVLSVYSFFFFLLLLFSVIPLSSASSEECPPFFDCGYLGRLCFPLTTPQRKHCGMLPIHGCAKHHNEEKTVYFRQKKFQVTRFNPSSLEVFVRDTGLEKRLATGSCDALCCNITLPLSSPLGSFHILSKITMYKCNGSLNYNLSKQFLNYTGCSKSNHNETIFFRTQDQDNPPASLTACPMVQVPVNTMAFSADPFSFIATEFPISIQLSDDCRTCVNVDKGLCLLNSTGGFYCSKFKVSYNKGICLLDGKGAFYCSKSKETADQSDSLLAWKLRLIVGGAIGSFGVVIICLIVILLWSKQIHKSSGSQNQSSSIESENTPSNAILESRNVYFGVPVFSYEQLDEATDRFDQSRQLGRGGFGTVYYGKLKDGREVAVKRLFEKTHRGEQQFMNEVQILTRLRHKNLVSLYGCTSRASHELLLVYEYISNGTLGCHLHGNLAKPGSLPWPVRMRIAIETANALTYLHACGIIHRDVKSSNLLLDHHFCVKVADFGISRLFPMFVSHVSTAPAGTPGYLDPGYYQYCQLTEKSDVYSFGVVLIELISSKPAIFTRDKEKINLANQAVDQIQRGAFSELVDPSLGFESDDKVREMIISVAKLAFWCLQRDVDPRPSMDEVMEFLQKIENGRDEIKHLEFHSVGFSNMETYTSLPTSVHRDRAASLNNSRRQDPPPTV